MENIRAFSSPGEVPLAGWMKTSGLLSVTPLVSQLLQGHIMLVISMSSTLLHAVCVHFGQLVDEAMASVGNGKIMQPKGLTWPE
jgi:hypothetical protein